MVSPLPTQCTRGGSDARGAPKRAIHALPSSLSSLLPTPYPTGSPLHSDHALFPTFFSLLSTSYFGRTAELPRGARPSAPSTHYPLPSSPYSLLPTLDARQNCRAGAPTRANHALFPTFFSLLSTSYFGRTAELPCGRAHARHPRTTLSPLLPTLYFLLNSSQDPGGASPVAVFAGLSDDDLLFEP